MLDAADDLAHFASDLNLGAEKLLGLRNSLAGEDHANLELQFCKIIVGNLCFRLDIDALGFSSSSFSGSAFAATAFFCSPPG